MLAQHTVLVIDDELGPREALRIILQAGYRVLLVAEGEQAVRLVEQEPVDVVLLDLHMPGLSGMRLLEKIKAINPAIVVIVVTAYASEDAVLEGARLCVFEYIFKPFPVAHVRETVGRAVAQQSQ